MQDNTEKAIKRNIIDIMTTCDKIKKFALTLFDGHVQYAARSGNSSCTVNIYKDIIELCRKQKYDYDNDNYYSYGRYDYVTYKTPWFFHGYYHFCCEKSTIAIFQQTCDYVAIDYTKEQNIKLKNKHPFVYDISW
jgi:hypothetical protein